MLRTGDGDQGKIVGEHPVRMGVDRPGEPLHDGRRPVAPALPQILARGVETPLGVAGLQEAVRAQQEQMSRPERTGLVLPRAGVQLAEAQGSPACSGSQTRSASSLTRKAGQCPRLMRRTSVPSSGICAMAAVMKCSPSTSLPPLTEAVSRV